MKKPVIGMMTFMGDLQVSTPKSYVCAVRNAGGQPVLLPPVTTDEDIQQQIELCDGFVFIGGPDLDPRHYGQEAHPNTKILPKEIDEFYMKIADAVLNHSDKPALGICLGCQLINVAMGGSLWQHIPEDFPDNVKHSMRPENDLLHLVTLTPDSPLRDILKMDSLLCNSTHHQAVRSPGKGLVIAATAPDGVVESVCAPDLKKRFIVALQWHPEGLQDRPQHRAPFEAFIAAAADKMR